MIFSKIVQKGNAELQDRVAVFHFGKRAVIAIADGAGGISGGAEAAEMLIQTVAKEGGGLNDPIDCCRLLEKFDLNLRDSDEGGETTGIVLVISEIEVFGASVGDSAAWVFSSFGSEELTFRQVRKPFLGTGAARPCSFRRNWSGFILVAATDGLWKYGKLEALRECVLKEDEFQLAERLVSLVALPSGAFPDDVAIVTCSLGKLNSTGQ